MAKLTHSKSSICLKRSKILSGKTLFWKFVYQIVFLRQIYIKILWVYLFCGILSQSIHYDIKLGFFDLRKGNDMNIKLKCREKIYNSYSKIKNNSTHLILIIMFSSILIQKFLTNNLINYILMIIHLKQLY